MMRGLRIIAPLAVALLALLAPAVANAQAAPSNYTYATRYDAAHRVVGTIAPEPSGVGATNYAATRTTFDAAGRIIRVEKGALSSWQSEALAPSAWPTWNGAAGFQIFSKVETNYDALDRKTDVSLWGSDDGGATWTQTSLTQFGYDAVGRLECTAVRMDPARWNVITSACNLQSITTSPQGPDRITKNVYDDDGQLLTVIKAFRQTTANGLEQLQQDYATYTYTDNGKQKTLIDANGNKTTYQYDGFDRLVAWQFPSKTAPGQSAPCTVGSPTETSDAFGNVVGGPSEARTTGDDCEKYAYDGNGNRAKLMKRDGSVIRYAYDALDRSTLKDIPGGTASDVYYDYDSQGLQLSARFAAPNGEGITNEYDAFGRLKKTTNNMGTTSRTLNYEYDPNGNRTKLTYPDASYFTYDYDVLDRLTAIREPGATAIVSSNFNVQGRLLSQTRGAVTSTFGYDAISRPTNWTDDLAGTASDVTTTFAYNAANQPVTKGRSNNAYAWSGYTTVSRDYTTNALNQYTGTTSAAGNTSFTYDDNGNLTSSVTVGGASSSYAYDVENRMTSVTLSGITSTLKYDPLGRLWQLVTPSKTLEFTHDGDSIVMELNGANPFRYVHGPGIDDPMIEYSGTGYSARVSLQSDYQGSIVSRADAAGNKTSILSYDEYGIPLSSNTGRFQYTGQAWLSQVGLYYYKARMYSPTLGRFMQTDPIGYVDDVNLYAYVGNDPIGKVDVTGKRKVDIYVWDSGPGSGTKGTMGHVLITEHGNKGAILLNIWPTYVGTLGPYTSSIDKQPKTFRETAMLNKKRWPTRSFVVEVPDDASFDKALKTLNGLRTFSVFPSITGEDTTNCTDAAQRALAAGGVNLENWSLTPSGLGDDLAGMPKNKDGGRYRKPPEKPLFAPMPVP